MNPTASSGAVARPKKKNTHLKARIAFLMVLVGIGFFAGVKTTLKIADGSPDWLRKIWGVADWKKASDLSGVSVPTANAPKANQAAPSVPTSESNTPTPSVDSSKPGFAGNSGQALAQSRPVDPALSDELSRKVTDYNAVLRNLQASFAQFLKTHKDATDLTIPSEQSQAAADQEFKLSESFVSDVQKAQQKLDDLQKEPTVTAKTAFGTPALDPAAVRRAFPELSVESLRPLNPK